MDPYETTESNLIADQLEVKNLIRLLAEKIISKHPDLSQVGLIGILNKGYPLALRLQKLIIELTGIKCPTGKLATSLYRDDILTRNGYISIQESDIPYEVTDRHIILIDDVLFEGRTLRAALNALTDFGRPSLIEFAVLIDRNEVKLPLHATYSSCHVTPPPHHKIKVNFLEIEGQQDTICLVPIDEDL